MSRLYVKKVDDCLHCPYHEDAGRDYTGRHIIRCKFANGTFLTSLAKEVMGRICPLPGIPSNYDKLKVTKKRAVSKPKPFSTGYTREDGGWWNA